ncbi:hypothetical protein [Streptomyces chartreusis]
MMVQPCPARARAELMKQAERHAAHPRVAPNVLFTIFNVTHHMMSVE